jgi:hypothetical protein
MIADLADGQSPAETEEQIIMKATTDTLVQNIEATKAFLTKIWQMLNVADFSDNRKSDWPKYLAHVHKYIVSQEYLMDVDVLAVQNNLSDKDLLLLKMSTKLVFAMLGQYLDIKAAPFIQAESISSIPSTFDDEKDNDRAKVRYIAGFCVATIRNINQKCSKGSNATGWG